MRKVTVPVDMASEQKDVLGIISKRQMIYLFVFGIIMYLYVPLVFNLFYPLTWVLALIVALLSTIPSLVALYLLAFHFVHKRHVFYDRYLVMRFTKHSQYGNWRKGSPEFLPTYMTREMEEEGDDEE